MSDKTQPEEKDPELNLRPSESDSVRAMVSDAAAYISAKDRRATAGVAQSESID